MQQKASGWAHALVFYTVLLFTLVLALPANAVTLEQVAGSLERGRRVYDFAGVLSASERRALNDQLATLENSGLVEPVVVLLDRAEGATVQEYALGLGERWKVGRRDTDNGLVFVASISERKTWVEVGRDAQALLPDTVITRLQREELVPAFRGGRYAAGLQGLFGAVQQTLERAGGTEALPRRSEPVRSSSGLAWLTLLFGLGTLVLAFRAWPRGSATADPLRLPTLLAGFLTLGIGLFAGMQSPGEAVSMAFLALPATAFAGLRLFEGNWVHRNLETDLDHRPVLIFAGVLGVGLLAWMLLQPSGWMVAYLALAIPFFFAVRGYFHRVPRRCPECGGNLRWVAERDEPEFLKASEDAEQRLGSVNYDVWRCDQCRRSAIFNRGAGPAPHEACPQCGRHTLTRHAQMLGGPAFRGQREMEVVTECHNPECRHRDVQRRPVDRGGWGGGWGDGGGFGGGGIIFIPPIFGGGWGGGGGGHHGDSGGWGGGDFGGIDPGDFGGGGGFDGGGGGVDW